MESLLIQVFSSLLILFCVFGIVEHGFGNKRGKRPRGDQLGLDVKHAIFNQIVTKWLVSLAVLSLATAILTPLVILGVQALDAEGQYKGFGPIASAPLWLQCIAAVLLGDFLLYWIHRLFHGRKLWAFHAVHHSSVQLDWISTFRSHPVNEVVGNIFLAAPFLLLGFSPAASLISPALLGLYTILVHADVDWTFGPLRYVVVSPAYHRWHHSKAPEAIDRNFASLLPLWDLCFGTSYLPSNKKPTDFGIHEPIASTWSGQMLHPFRKK
ncbi:MAG: sterol desaturase family protein [Verrucomicrobia bacterium]|nr:sterol desaturase family protein [Verrucomicrobiota bacterium]